MPNENANNRPPPSKRPRGPYRQYLLPGALPIIPISTLRSRRDAAAARNNLLLSESNQTEDENSGSDSAEIRTNEETVCGADDNNISGTHPPDHGMPLLGTLNGAVMPGISNEAAESSDNGTMPASGTIAGDTGAHSRLVEEEEAEAASTISTSNLESAASPDEEEISYQAALLSVCEDILVGQLGSSEPNACEDIITSVAQSLAAPTGEAQDGGTENLGEMENLWEKRKQFFKRHGLEERIHPNIETTRYEAMLMVLHLALRHHHTGAFIVDLMKFVNARLGTNALSPSLHIFSKSFSTSTGPQYHFLCPQCNLYLGEKTSFNGLSSVTCSQCECECNVADINSPNVFLSVPIAKQIQDLLRRPDIKLVSNRRSSEDIGDVMDGELYKELAKKVQVPFLTVCLNTDGVQAFEIPGKSLWPILLCVNELIPAQRLKPENVILAGLYFGKSAPDMSWFLRPLVEEFKTLAKDGIWAPNGKGQNVRFLVFVLMISLDLIAKAKVQVCKQCNGMYGCGFCLHPNYFWEENRRIFGYHAHKSYPLRTHESLRSDMITAHELAVADKLRQLPDTSVRGALGLSPALALPEVNIVDGFAIDYMHNGLEGIVPLLIRIWLDGQYRDESFYLAPYVSKIDEQLSCLTLPEPMRPKRLSARAEWKAKDWRAFVLYYGLPILKQFLPQKYYDHFAKYAVGLHLLLKESITRADMDEAERLLTDFVKCFKQLYPKELIVHNVHLPLHYRNCVSKIGPLWGCSNFVFESCNGLLLKYLAGTKFAAHEIAKKYLVMQSVSQCFDLCSSPLRDGVVDFCTDVCSFSLLQRFERCSDGSVLTNVPTVVDITPEETECLRGFHTDFPPGKILFYNRIIKDQTVYCSKAYTRLAAHNNSCAQLIDGSYAVIDKIIKLTEEEKDASAMIKPIRLSNQPQDHLAPHIKACAFDMFEPLRIVPFSVILKKCVLVTVRCTETEFYSYVCDYPNFYERE